MTHGIWTLRHKALTWIALAAVIALGTATATAQNPRRRLPPPQFPPAQTQPPPQPAQTENQEKPTAAADDDPIVRELRTLVKSIESLKEQQKVQAATLFLQTQQTRYASLDARIAGYQATVQQLKIQAQTNQQRLRYIPGEALARGIISQSEAETRIRGEVEAEDARLRGEIAVIEGLLAASQFERERLKLEIEQLAERLRGVIESDLASPPSGSSGRP
jgi:hypothetical protein